VSPGLGRGRAGETATRAFARWTGLGLLIFGIARPGLCVAPGPRQAGAAAPSAGELEQRIAPLVRSLVATGVCPGASLAIARRGEPPLIVHAGFARLPSRTRDGEAGKQVDDTVVFPVGSISKALTVALISRLVDDGKLAWDRNLESYVPAFPHPGRGITLRRIAGHLSGLGDEANARLYTTRRHFPTIGEALEEIRGEALQAEPGSRFSYATSSFTWLAAAIERAEGKPFMESMRERVLTPLEMSQTRANLRNREDRSRAVGYERASGGGFSEAPYADPSFKLPGAGFLSSARDLARFGTALLGSGFLSETSKAELFRAGRTRDGKPTGWGLGFLLDSDPRGRERAVTPGGGPGITTRLVLYPGSGLVAVLLTNMTSAEVDSVAERVLSIAVP